MVYIGIGRSFNSRSLDKLKNIKFNGLVINEIEIKDLVGLKRAMVNKYRPIHNKIEEKKVKRKIPEVSVPAGDVSLSSSYLEKAAYCKDRDISLAELEKKLKENG